MTKQLRNILVPLVAVLPILASGTTARAEMFAPTAARPAAQHASVATPHSEISLGLQIPTSSLAIPSELIPKSDSVLQLPAAPGSTQLFLSALMSVGLWQAGRSIKHIHVGHLPDWYHTGAVQVGHVTPFDLEFSALPVCIFEEPVAQPVFVYRIPRERCSQLVSQFFLFVESPRGPPALA